MACHGTVANTDTCMEYNNKAMVNQLIQDLLVRIQRTEQGDYGQHYTDKISMILTMLDDIAEILCEVTQNGT